LDIPYELGHPNDIPATRFLSIWKVEVNERYRSPHPQGLKDPGLFITYEGGGVLHDLAAQQSHRLEAGTFLLIDRRVPCRYECPPRAEWKFYFIHFSDLLMAEHLGLPVLSVCRSNVTEYAVSQCERLVQCLINRKLGHMYTANQSFQDILVSFARERAEREGGKGRDVSQVIYWMHRNLDQCIEIDSLVAMSGMSRGLFFRAFKVATGTTPASYFLKLKLESARLALQTTDHTLKRIAQSLQFCDEFHFAKLFKKEYGIPPSKYRAMVR
jgi:AraC-like DNA-binding protein